MYSNAFNFSSYLDGSVDVRTGQFNASINLVTLRSLLNSDLDRSISLSYSMMNAGWTGYGTGWNLVLSSYDDVNLTMTLADGRGFKVIAFSGENQQASFEDKKINDFYAEEMDDVTVNIVYKDGTTETLKKIFPELPYVLTLITFENGEYFSFDYNNYGRLSSITDTYGVEWLSMRYSSGGDLGAAYVRTGASMQAKMTFLISNVLSSVSVVDESEPADSADTHFIYDTVEGFQVITQITNPLGGVQRIDYQSQGHQIPGGDWMPYVTQWLMEPTAGQQPVCKRYNYSSPNNFTGYGVTNPWSDYDNLYQYDVDYNYWGEELLVDNTDLNTIYQTQHTDYNRFHLQTRQSLKRDKKSITVDIEYNEIPGETFDRQPTTLQLPKKTITTFTDESTGDHRSEFREMQYDDCGNITYQKDNTGIEIVTVYYDPDGETGCPPSTNGMIRYCKSVSKSTGSLSGTKVEFEYDNIPTSGSINTMVLCSKRTITDPDYSAPISVTTYSYKVSSNTVDGTTWYLGPFLSSFQKSMNDKTTTIGVDDTLDVSVGQRTSLVQLTGHDELTQTRSVVLNIYTMNTTQFVSAEGVKATMEYDALGRLISRSLAVGSSYETTESFSYLFAVNGVPASITFTERFGNQRRTELDGLGREVRSYRAVV